MLKDEIVSAVRREFERVIRLDFSGEEFAETNMVLFDAVTEDAEDVVTCYNSAVEAGVSDPACFVAGLYSERAMAAFEELAHALRGGHPMLPNMD